MTRKFAVFIRRARVRRDLALGKFARDGLNLFLCVGE
jgi:hypothetical protein